MKHNDITIHPLKNTRYGGKLYSVYAREDLPEEGETYTEADREFRIVRVFKVDTVRQTTRTIEFWRIWADSRPEDDPDAKWDREDRIVIVEADEEEEEDLTPFRIYTREYLVPGKRYTFRGGDICDSFVFDSYDGNEALFEEFVHDQTDGHEESRGEIRFDIYQVSRLITRDVDDEEAADEA